MESYSHSESPLFVGVSASSSVNHWPQKAQPVSQLQYAHSVVCIYCLAVLFETICRPSLSLPDFIFCLFPSSSSFSGTHCGYILPPVMVSARDTISITFQSDSRLTDRGFSAKWEAVYPEDIGGTEHTTYTQGTILTPRGTCWWSSSTLH